MSQRRCLRSIRKVGYQFDSVDEGVVAASSGHVPPMPSGIISGTGLFWGGGESYEFSLFINVEGYSRIGPEPRSGGRE
jgi:hypothetical protein